MIFHPRDTCHSTLRYGSLGLDSQEDSPAQQRPGRAVDYPTHQRNLARSGSGSTPASELGNDPGREG